MLNGSRFFAEFPDENPDRAPDCPRNGAIPVVPDVVRQFAHRKDRVGALPNVEIPGFLKRGPRTEEDVMSFASPEADLCFKPTLPRNSDSPGECCFPSVSPRASKR
jgi:hypothetical protein